MTGSVCVITFKSDGTTHMVCDNRKFAKAYCKSHREYEWECYTVQTNGSGGTK